MQHNSLTENMWASVKVHKSHDRDSEELIINNIHAERILKVSYTQIRRCPNVNLSPTDSKVEKEQLLYFVIPLFF